MTRLCGKHYGFAANQCENEMFFCIPHSRLRPQLKVNCPEWAREATLGCLSEEKPFALINRPITRKFAVSIFEDPFLKSPL